VSNDEGYTFKRVSDGPVLDRDSREPYLTVTPYVIDEDNHFKMWYATGTEWVQINDKLEPVYAITYATSMDGLTWERTGKVCVKQRHAQEALCTPTIISQKGVYKMWFSCRDSTDFRDGAGSYRVGYAESNDGLEWTRIDQKAGIERSADGWDSTMLCYPNVVKYNNQYYMFYNGNSFGRYGFGYAVHSSEGDA
jgi:hypothetical protein